MTAKRILTPVLDVMGQAQQTSRGIQIGPIHSVFLWFVGLYLLSHGFSAIYAQVFQYGAFSDEVGFLPLKRAYHGLWIWKAALYVHVFSSLFALVAGFTQFVKIRRPWMARLHRLIGRISVIAILCLAAPSGMVLAWFAEGGFVGRSGFVLLSVLWMVTTTLGWRRAVERRLEAHRAWMVRSYSLTFSAVTLREWVFWLWVAFPDFETSALVAWLSWVPNLVIGEIWLRWRAGHLKN